MAKQTEDRSISLSLRRSSALIQDADRLAMIGALLSQITSAQNAQDAGTFLRMVRERIRRIKAHYSEVRAPLNRAVTDIRTMEKADLAPWEQADKTVSAPLLAWSVAEEQRVIAENRRRLAQAEDAARQERVAQAEAIRAAAATAPTKGVAKALERQAKDVEKAPLMLRAPEPATEPAKVAGITVPKRRTATVVDLALLVQAVARGEVALDALTVNQTWLDARARELGSQMRIPGVLFEEKPILTARA